MSSYATDELAELLGCVKYASSIKQALADTGFIDADGFIHDWEDHAGYHKQFSDRAKMAAEARWGKKKEPKKKERGQGTEDIGDKHCLTHACSIYEAYPRKVGKPAALKAITRAVSKFGLELVLERTKAFSEARKGQDIQFTPHPATWFNQERFNDDPATWVNHSHSHKPSNGISPSVQAMIDSKELERVTEKMRTIKATYGDHQSWTTSDLEQFRELKERKLALKKALGITV
jgi:hypothetical protein